jgi:hypothetical protein
LVLTGHPCIPHVVVGPDHVERLLIRTSKRSLTIVLTGQRASRGPVQLMINIPPSLRLKRIAAILASYADLLNMKPRWTKRTRDQELIRDSLIAVDGRAAGASHREVAEIIFGHRRVREEWSARGGWMKDRMWRALTKGEMLCGADT